MMFNRNKKEPEKENDVSMGFVYGSPERMDKINDGEMATIYASPDFFRFEAVEMREVNGMPGRDEETISNRTTAEYPYNHAVLEEETCRICRSCGEAVPFSKKFCPHCGAFLSGE